MGADTRGADRDTAGPVPEGQPGSVLAGEVAKFDALAERWWDADGPMRPLHAMNAVRVGWIAARLGGTRGGTDGKPADGKPMEGKHTDGKPKVRLLDVGCGAGIAAEAFARLGFDVLGIDAAAGPIAAARAHADEARLGVAYRVATAEELLREGRRFDAVTALEVVEHVADPGAFLRTLSGLLGPGGRLFVTTLNRTPRSFAVAKLGAEYVLRMLPVGTHDWRRFVTPAELGVLGRAAGLRLEATGGMGFDPVRQGWRETRDLAVNYLACLTKPG